MKRKPDEYEVARAALATMTPPRSQAQWREASTLLRRIRRICRARHIGFMATIECGSSRRYLMCDTWSRAATCYNGGGSSFPYLSNARRLYALGDKSRRVDFMRWRRKVREERNAA